MRHASLYYWKLIQEQKEGILVWRGRPRRQHKQEGNPNGIV
jgi:hypothetical protein